MTSNNAPDAKPAGGSPTTAVRQSSSLPPVQGPSYYKEIALSPSVGDPRRLVYIAEPDSPKKLPSELLALRQEFSRTARVAAILFEDEVETRRQIFLMLHQGADRGLRGAEFNIEDGRGNLEEAKEAITDYAHRVRDRRLRDYTLLAGLIGVLPLLVGFGVLQTAGFGHLHQPSPGNPYDPLFAWILATFWIPAGAAICVWAEFVLRMQAGLSYEQLMYMDPSRWRPGQRLLITIGISFIFAFLLAFNAVQVGVANLLLNDFAGKTPALSLAVGGITGLAFVAVRDIVFKAKPEERK